MSTKFDQYSDVLTRLVQETVACTPQEWTQGTLTITTDGVRINYSLKNPGQAGAATISDALKTLIDELYVRMRQGGDAWSQATVSFFFQGENLKFETNFQYPDQSPAVPALPPTGTPKAVASPATGQLNGVWQVKIEGKVYEADTNTLIEWAAGGYVQPGDKVKKGSLDWTEAKNVPVLRGPLQQFQMNPPQPQQPQGYANPAFQNQGYASPGYGNPAGDQGWYGGQPEKPKTGLMAFMARFETPIFSGYVLWLTAFALLALAVSPVIWLAASAKVAFFFLLCVGVLISAIGFFGFLSAAFNVNFLWGLGCFLIPGLSLVFLILNWEVAKRPFIVNLIGTFVVFASYVPLLYAFPSTPEESRFIHRNGIISVARPGTEPATVLSLPVRLS